MAYEIIGSRMLGPFVGTSMIVWSSIIGIILLSLSLGYYYGGRIADKHPDHKRLSMIIAGAGAFILISLLFKNSLLETLILNIENIYFVSLISSLVLFSIPAVLLGMVSPFAARLKIKDKKTAGATVGYLYAISTIGSITGTFFAGFYLIPGYKLSQILLILSVILITLALYLFLMHQKNIAFTPKEIISDEEN